jgi:hypothetical protein
MAFHSGRSVAGAIVVVAALCAVGGAGAAGDEAETRAQGTPPTEERSTKVEILPLPMYTTVPTEGSTYGVMPVILDVNAAGAVQAIGAPSVSWNSAAGVTGTLRFYYYPSRVRALSVIAAASTHVNRTLWITYSDLPIAAGRATLEVDALARRNIFYRFFGLGPDSLASDQTSYTRTTASLTARWGWNLPGHLNLGARGTVRGDRPTRDPIFGLPATQDLFPSVPGISGAGLAAGELSLRFDTRSGADYAAAGVASELRGSYNRGLSAFDQFWQLTWQTRALLQETAFLQSAGRVYWTQEAGGGAGVPFYYQSILGGDSLLRGFPDDRFIDRAAWEAEIEQRIRLFETHFFDVATDWRVDPFIAVGQVYDQWDEIASRVQVAVGAGLRAWVKPNVLGRVDVAYAGEGLNAYVVIGYPY